MAGEALIVATSAMALEASTPIFGGGAALWAAALALVSASGVMPMLANAIGSVASLLFAAVALQIFSGAPLTPLTQPLPFFAYPFLALTLFSWAFVEFKRPSL